MSMTSTQQVERLQALLEKVKQNRDAAREAPAGPARAAAAMPAASAQVAAAPRAAPAAPAPAPTAKKPAASAQAPTTPVGMPTPMRRAPAIEEELDFSSLPPPGASRAPAQEPAFTPAERRTRPGATPLELAVEDTLDRPAVSPVVSQPARPPAPAAAQPAPAPPVAQAAQRRDGVVLADPAPPNPGRPIAQTISKQPPISPTSFGDLLKRSLSLRPR
jgi:translation initiation factor IF-2